MKPISFALTFALLLAISCKKDAEVEDTSSETVPGVSEFKSIASIGDTLQISGDNFPTTSGLLQVYFNDQKANIISQDGKSVSFVVPLLSTDSCNVYFKDNKGAILKQQSFKLDAVRIVSTVSKVKSGETLTIYGKNFQRLSNLNVTVNNKKIDGITVNASGISFTMPDTIYPGRKPTINVSSGATSNT